MCSVALMLWHSQWMRSKGYSQVLIYVSQHRAAVYLHHQAETIKPSKQKWAWKQIDGICIVKLMLWRSQRRRSMGCSRL